MSSDSCGPTHRYGLVVSTRSTDAGTNGQITFVVVRIIERTIGRHSVVGANGDATTSTIPRLVIGIRLVRDVV